VRSTPPTDEWAKRRAIHQFFGDKNSDFDAISLFFRKTATKSADLNPFKIVADFQLIDPSNERQNIPSFWISPTIFVNYTKKLRTKCPEQLIFCYYLISVT